MASIRIISTPPGEAPLEIREAWVGLVLPLSRVASETPTLVSGYGALTGPKNFFSRLFCRLTRCFSKHTTQYEAYRVEARVAFQVLEKSRPEAAAWWYRETPHLVNSQVKFLFPAECCQLEAAAPGYIPVENI